MDTEFVGQILRTKINETTTRMFQSLSQEHIELLNKYTADIINFISIKFNFIRSNKSTWYF